MSAPSVGVRIPQYGSTWPEVRDFALRAERLGFEGIWVNDHLQSPGRVKAEPVFDALTTLAALAALTERPRLGVAVLAASYRPAPLAAKMATILDVISGGRLIVGLGTGSDVPEHRAYGVPFGSPGERTAGLREALEVMRAMFDHPEGADVEGALAGAPNQPPPVQPGGPPILLAAHRRRLLRLAGERADGIVAAFVGAETVAERLAVAEEARAAAGRPPLRCALYTFALPVPSRREAEAWLAPEAEALGSTPAGVLRWLRGTGIVAPPDELAAELERLGAAGVTDAGRPEEGRQPGAPVAQGDRHPVAAPDAALAEGAARPRRRLRELGERPAAGVVHRGRGVAQPALGVALHHELDQVRPRAAARRGGRRPGGRRRQGGLGQGVERLARDARGQHQRRVGHPRRPEPLELGGQLVRRRHDAGAPQPPQHSGRCRAGARPRRG